VSRAKLPAVLADPEALVPPAFYHCPEYVTTIGPEAVDLVTLFGRTPNPEQALLLDDSFGMDRRGRLAAFEIAVIASRQNLKTGFFEFRALAKALLLKRPLQIWTAHKESATDQALADFKEMIEASAELSRRVKGFTEGKGAKSLQFVNGCTIVFRPRTGKAGQSMSANDVDLDELFAAEPRHLGSLLPTLSTRANAQVGMASSAPHEGSDYERTVMARGRAASEGRAVEPRLLYAEWSVQRLLGTNLDGSPKYGPAPCESEDCGHGIDAVGCIADNREMIKLANPSVGRSSAPAIGWDYIDDERRVLQDAIEEYFRERLSSGCEDKSTTGQTIFGPAAHWQRCGLDLEDEDAEVEAPHKPEAIGIAVSVDRTVASIAASAMLTLVAADFAKGRRREVTDDDDAEIETIEVPYVAPVDRRDGVAWVIAEAKRIQDDTECLVLVDEKGPTSDLIKDLEDAGVKVTTLTLDECSAAYSRIYDRVTIGGLIHPNASELDDAVGGAAWRMVGDRRVLGRRQSVEEVSMLEAGTFAIYGADVLGAGSAYEERGLNVW